MASYKYFSKMFAFIVIVVLSSSWGVPITNSVFNPHLIVYPSENSDTKRNITETKEYGGWKEKKAFENYCKKFQDEYRNGTQLAADVDQNEITCYEVGSQGPCPPNMKFYAVPDNGMLGMCDCAQDLNGVVYNPDTNACHYLYKQEYCPEDYWLEQLKEKLVCTPNVCQASSEENSTTKVFYNNECTTLHGFCTMSDGSLGYIDFDGDNKVRCLFEEMYYSIVKVIPQLQCVKGTRWSTISNTCDKAVSFAFD